MATGISVSSCILSELQAVMTLSVSLSTAYFKVQITKFMNPYSTTAVSPFAVSLTADASATASVIASDSSASMSGMLS